MKKRKGVTLLELILALALFSIVIAMGTNLFIFGNKVQKVSANEADMQAKTRLTAEHINNITRFATKTHTIPRSSFQNSENGVRDPNTSYIGITKEGHVVIDEPNPSLGTRKIQYLAKKQDGIEYEIIFNKVNDESGNLIDTALNFSIVGKKDGKIVNEIASQVEILNSFSVEYLGTQTDPAVALAFSLVEPGSQEWIEISPDAYITLVLDVSGSMEWDMDGKNTSINNRRLTILKEKALKMIDRLAALDFNIYVSVVPFSNNANNPSDFKNLQVESERIDVINQITGLNANGATNTGDGIRRGYYRLKNKANSLISGGKEYADFTQHMMILVDGETNTETRTILSRSWLLGYYVTSEKQTEADGNTNNSVVVGNHRTVSVSDNNNNYINHLGTTLIKPYKFEFEGEQKQAINSFVIGFSNLTKDHNSLNAIGNAVNGKQFEHSGGMKPYILAKDADELDFAFEQFEAEVENSLWVITRPQLWP